MAAFEWVRFLLGTGLLLAGVAVFFIEMIGVFRFKYVLNRMHAAALGDTLGLSCCLLGLIVMSGLNFTSLKMFLVIVFLWFSSPVSSHLIARLEVTTNEDEDPHYEMGTLDEPSKEGEAERSLTVEEEVKEEKPKEEKPKEEETKEGKIKEEKVRGEEPKEEKRKEEKVKEGKIKEKKVKEGEAKEVKIKREKTKEEKIKEKDTKKKKTTKKKQNKKK